METFGGFVAVTGLVVLNIGHLWLAVIIARENRSAGLVSLLIPITGLYFIRNRWSDGRTPIIFWGAGAGVFLIGGIVATIATNPSSRLLSDKSKPVVPKEIRVPPEKQIRGNWVAVRREFRGESTSAEGYSYSFDGATFKAVSPDETIEGTYDIAERNDPMHITFEHPALVPSLTYIRVGIFKFEGRKLILCVDPTTYARPKDFSTSKSSTRILFEFQRESELK